MVDATLNLLVAHQDSRYEEWGFTGSVRCDPGLSGRRLSLTLTPSLGAASQGADRLWAMQDIGGLIPYGAAPFDMGGQLGADVGYGMADPGGRGTGTPYAGLSQSGMGYRALRYGWRWAVDQRSNVGVEGARQDGLGGMLYHHGNGAAGLGRRARRRTRCTCAAASRSEHGAAVCRGVGFSGWPGLALQDGAAPAPGFCKSAIRSSVSSTTCPIRTWLPAGPHDGLGPRGEVPDFDRDVRHRAFFPPLVRVDDGSRSKVRSPRRRDLLRDYETHRTGVDDSFDRRSSDVRLYAQSEVHGSAVVPVFRRHAGSNLSIVIVLRF